MKPLLPLFCVLLLCGCETVPVPTPQPQHKPITNSKPISNKSVVVEGGFTGPVYLIPPIVPQQFVQVATNYTRSMIQQPPKPAITNIAVTVPAVTEINQRVVLNTSPDVSGPFTNLIGGSWGTNVCNWPCDKPAEFAEPEAQCVTFMTQADADAWLTNH